MSTGSLIKRVYGGFRGVDFRGDECDLTRSPDALNMWKDYKKAKGIQTRPELRTLMSFSDDFQGAGVNGIFIDNGSILLHIGTHLMTIVEDGNGGMEFDQLLHNEMSDCQSEGFFHEDSLYIKDGKNYIVTNPDGSNIVEGYVPTTSIGRKPAGGGTVYEDVNMLTGRRINTFLADGESTTFYLDATDIDTDFAPIVKVDGSVVTSGYTVDYTKGMISFTEAPSAPKTDGQDNVSVEFSKTIDGYRERIEQCTLLQVFDNRVFFSGNPNYPNMVWHSALNDPTYVSDLDYYREGVDNAQITGMVAGNNALWVFREPSNSNTTIFYHTPTIDDEYGKIYPSVHSSIAIGCVGKAINFNDDIVFFSGRGMEGISGDVTTEQVVAHRSSLVDRKLLAEVNYKNMVIAEWAGYLLVAIDSRIYLADSRGKFTNNDHWEYEWFYWELDLVPREERVTCMAEHDGVLYIGTDLAVYTISQDDYEDTWAKSYWTTPKDKFNYPNKLKTTSKKSCTVEAEGEKISVSAKTNKDEGFQLLGTFTDVTDAFNCRIKKKKFKDIQLRFKADNYSFSLDSATLECYIGGYLKNL